MPVRIRSLSGLVAIVGAFAILSCTSVTDIPVVTACATTGVTTLAKVFDDNTTVHVGDEVNPFVFATNSNGDPVCQVSITWTPGTGSGTASPSPSPTINSNDEVLVGTATTKWIVGSSLGVQTLVATVSNSSPAISTTFTATVFSASTCLPVRVITVTDDFLVGDHWSTASISSDGTVSHTESQQSTGGNPGGYRKMTQVLSPPAGSSGTSNQTVLHLYTFFNYNPSISGDLCSVDYSEDQINLGGGNIGWGPVLTQGGIVYTYHPSPFFTSASWAHQEKLNLIASDFSPAGLDFGHTGGAISFGYFRSSTTGANPTLAVTTNHGIDNWTFQLHGQ